ncbi:MAG: hypothetical protein ACOCXM_08925 [Myxococcota bacterium]
MRDRELYARMLDVQSPWRVVDVELDEQGRQVEVFIERDRRSRLTCPECGEPASGYDVRERRWGVNFGDAFTFKSGDAP